MVTGGRLCIVITCFCAVKITRRAVQFKKDRMNMGKRRRARSSESDIEKIHRKVRKLERKLRRYRRSSSSSTSTDRQQYGGDNDVEWEYEDKTDNEAPQEDDRSLQKPDELVDKAEQTPASATSEMIEEVLDPEILTILGEDPSAQQEYGDELHKDIATRWSHILGNGLSKEGKSEIMKQYLPAKNCIQMKAPKLNLEIEAALSATNVKKDLFSVAKQNQLSSCLTAIGKALNCALTSKNNLSQDIIKPLSDAGRLLSDCHYRETQSRRYAIMNNLNKQTRDAVKNTKIDEFLFGANLAEHLKSSKAISKTGSEIRSTVQRAPSRPPAPRQNQRGALNARGMARAPTFEPRQNPTPRRQAPAPRDRGNDSYRRNNFSRRGSRRQ